MLSCNPVKNSLRLGVLARSILLLSVILIITGCQAPSKKQSPANKTPTTLAARFAVVPPQQIDDTLTDEQLKKMFMPFDQIPLPKLTDIIDPNATPPSPPKTEILDPAAAKTYIQAKILIDENQYKQAADLLTNNNTETPSDPALLQLLAQAEFHIGRFDQAQTAAVQTIQRDPNNLNAWNTLAAVFQKKNQLPQALAVLKHAAQLKNATPENPLTALLRFQIASILMNMDYLIAAIEQYEIAAPMLIKQAAYAQTQPLMQQIIAQPHMPLITLASLYVQTGQMALALNQLNIAQKFLPPSADITRAFVLSITSQRVALRIRYQRIVAFCRYLIAAHPNPRYALTLFHNACQTLAKHNDYLTQINQWHITTIDNQTLLPPRLYAFALILAQQYDHAADILNKQIDPKQPDPGIQNDLADIYAKTKNWPKMIHHLHARLAADPHAINDITNTLKNTAQQNHDLYDTVKSDPNSAQLENSHSGLFLLAALAQNAGQFDTAEHYYNKALTLNPDFTPAFDNLIELLIQQNHFEQTLDLIKTHHGDFESDTHLLYYAAKAHTGLNQFTQAQHDYQKIIEKDPENLDAYLALSDVLIQQNQFTLAEQIDLRLLDRWPDNPNIDRHLFTLYARWNALPSIDKPLDLTTRRQSRKMLARWLTQEKQQDKSENPPALWERAADTLESLAKQYPDGKIINILLAHLYSSRNQLDKATQIMDRMLEIYPDDENMLVLAAEYHQKNNNLTRAAQLLKHRYLLNPDNPKWLLDCLQTFRRAEKYDDALDLLLSAADRPALQTLAAIQLLHEEAQKLFLTTRQYPRAVQYFQKRYWLCLYPRQTLPEKSPTIDDLLPVIADQFIQALTEAGYYDRAALHAFDLYLRYPDHALKPIIYLTHTLNARLLYSQSLKLIDACLAADPNIPVLHLEHALTLIENNQPQQAIDAARNWLSEKPDDPARRNIYLLALTHANQYDPAIQLLQNEIEAAPDPDLQFQLAELYLIAGRYELADQLLARINPPKKFESRQLEIQIKLDITQKKSQLALVRLDEYAGKDADQNLLQQFKIDILAACNQTAQAAELLKKRTEAHPDDLNAQLQYVIMVERAGDVPQAVALLENLLQKYPDSPVILNNLGYTLAEHNITPDRAGDLLKRSLQLEPAAASTLDSLGWFYYKDKQYEKALELLLQAAAGMIKTDYEIWDHIGDTMYRLDKKETAVKYWKKAQKDINDRLAAEHHLADHKARIDKKLDDASQGRPPDLAPLFND